MRTRSINQNQLMLGTDSSAVSDLGTVLWIGERQAPDFRDAYRYTESASSQMAYRSDWSEALSRPACDVRRVIVAQVDRSPVLASNVEQLANRYVDATWLALEGPLCAGTSRRQAHRPLANSCYLHQWQQHLPIWLERVPDKPAVVSSQPTHTEERTNCSLGIIAANSGTASTLMDLAAETLAASAWFRSLNSQRLRNFDVIWWDDSAAGEASADQWRNRLRPNSEHAFHDTTVHVWLTNTTRSDAIDEAYSAGVTTVLTKPFQVTPLLATLALHDDSRNSQNVGSTRQSRFAA